MMRFAFAWLFLNAPFGFAEDKPTYDFDGAYEVKEFTVDGKGTDEKIAAVLFKNGLMSVKTKDREDAAKFTVDASKAPFTIDFQPVAGEAKAVPGIWKLEKNELTIVFNKKGARPTDFRSTGEGTVKFILARVAPKKDK